MNVWRFGATFLTFQNGWNDINGKLMKNNENDENMKINWANKYIWRARLRSWLFKMDEMTLMDS